MTSLLDKARVEIKLGNYGVAPATALSDPGLLMRVQEYRRLASSRMVPLDSDDIRKMIPKAEYHVSRKVDGEFTVLVYRNGECLTLNPGGTVRTGLPWEEEAARILQQANVKSALIAGELYVHNEQRRPRVHDVTAVARQPQSNDDLSRLRFAVFDILAIDDKANERPFSETWQLIVKRFANGDRIHPVEAKSASNAEEIQKLYSQWVQDEGAEGLVVRSDTAGLFKIKPRHNLDAVVVGFTESVEDRQGLLHDLLVAVMRHDGTLHVLTRVGGGFSDEERRTILSDLKDLVVESEYAEVNSDHVAYQMVRPEWVVEVSCLDFISQTTRGGPVNRMVLKFKENGSTRYETVRRLPLAAVISPRFIRQRDDKFAQKDDVRIEQVSQRVEVPLADRDASQMSLPASTLLRRDVYTKEAKGETMVRKFVTWKSNKEQGGDDYPAFVLHFTDFSPNRKDPLAREVRVSSSLQQIDALRQEMIAANIKQGWNLRSSSAGAVSGPQETPQETPQEAPQEAPPSDVEVKMAPSATTRKSKAAKKKSG